MFLFHILQSVTPEAEKIAQRFSTDSLQTKGAEIAEILRNTPPKELIEEMVTSFIKFGIKLVFALILYFIGAWLIRKSKKFIAITILAGGTSMPELATCVVAAAKKKGQLALGNIIGSHVFNILLILGGSALISPLSFDHITYVDLGVLLVSALALLTAGFVGRKKMIDRLDGGLFLLIWAAYMAYLIYNL